MAALNIANSQILPKPVTSFLQGKAMRLAQENQRIANEAAQAELDYIPEKQDLARRRAQRADDALDIQKDRDRRDQERELTEGENAKLERFREDAAGAYARGSYPEALVVAKRHGMEEGFTEDVFNATQPERPPSKPTANIQESEEALRVLRDTTLSEKERSVKLGVLGYSDADAAEWQKKNDYHRARLNSDDPYEAAAAKRHFLGSGLKVEVTKDGTVTMSQGTNDLTTSATSELQKSIVVAEDAMREIEGLMTYIENTDVPSWAYGATGDFTQKLSSRMAQLSLPFSKWAEGKLNPEEARVMRSKSLVMGGKVISFILGETNRFTKEERDLAFKAAGVMTNPDSTPNVVHDSLKTVLPLVTDFVNKRRQVLLEGLSPGEAEIEKLRAEIIEMGGKPDA